MADTITCPWCAEEILAEARKCKHCGEYLTEDTPPPSPRPGTDDLALSDEPIWRFHGMVWRCVAHQKQTCRPCTDILAAPTKPAKKGDIASLAHPRYTGTIGQRKALSEVGHRPDGTLACPNCGGTQFTAKRSNTGKVLGGVLAPKSQVRCVSCRAMFKRS